MPKELTFDSEQSRASPPATSSRAGARMNWERLPFRLMIVYLLGTVLTFAFGPVDWPVENWRDLLVFVTAIFVALYVGYRLGARGPSRGTELRAWRWVFFVGATATIILLFPSALLYTGKMPWDVLQTAQDQGEAYQDLQYNLSLTTYQDRAAVAIMRTVVSPFAFAALPLGILHWRDLSWLLRLLFGATILSSIIFSSLRGTDREIADLVIIFFTTLLVVIARGMVYRDTSLLAEITRHRLAVFLITIFFATAALVFVERGQGRERITLQRLANASGDYEDLAEAPTVSAAVESLGEERYRFSIRWRPDLRGRQDLEPAMRVLWRDRTLDLDDVIVAPSPPAVDRTASVQLMATVRTIDTPDLLGHRRHQSWP